MLNFYWHILCAHGLQGLIFNFLMDKQQIVARISMLIKQLMKEKDVSVRSVLREQISMFKTELKKFE